MQLYPLSSHIPVLEYPHNAFDWDSATAQPILTATDDEIAKQLKESQGYHNFVLTWCVEGIDIRHMDCPVPFKIAELKYGDFSITFPESMKLSGSGEPITYFDLWKAADALARLNGTTTESDHAFLEGFIPCGENQFEVFIGS